MVALGPTSIALQTGFHAIVFKIDDRLSNAIAETQDGISSQPMIALAGALKSLSFKLTSTDVESLTI
jgi:hypothetical protein